MSLSESRREETDREKVTKEERLRNSVTNQKTRGQPQLPEEARALEHVLLIVRGRKQPAHPNLRLLPSRTVGDSISLVGSPPRWR